MDPIERVSDAVAALVGRDMTLEDAHQFILEAAQMMEPVKPIIIGGSEQEETHTFGGAPLIVPCVCRSEGRPSTRRLAIPGSSKTMNTTTWSRRNPSTSPTGG